MWMKIKMWVKRIWAQLFRRQRPAYTEKELTYDIINVLVKMSKKGRVNIFNGTIHGLRSAQADSSSLVYVVEIMNPPEKSTILAFREYAEKLKRSFKSNNENIERSSDG